VIPLFVNTTTRWQSADRGARRSPPDIAYILRLLGAQRWHDPQVGDLTPVKKLSPKSAAPHELVRLLGTGNAPVATVTGKVIVTPAW